MKELQLIDRVVVEIKSEEGAECMASCIANHLRIVAEQIENGMKGDNYVLERPSNGQKMEVLWEHECPNYGGFRILSDKSLICQYYYKSEPSPHVLSDKLRNEISEYLDSFGDDEQLSVEDISDLFFRANTLLVNVLEGK